MPKKIAHAFTSGINIPIKTRSSSRARKRFQNPALGKRMVSLGPIVAGLLMLAITGGVDESAGARVTADGAGETAGWTFGPSGTATSVDAGPSSRLNVPPNATNAPPSPKTPATE